jgi:nucleoid-associated protein YgaU
LALQYYGNARKWQQIYEANKETMKNPNYIYIGQKVLVPTDTQGPA